MIKITSDSTCDLSNELIAKYNVGIFPLTVILGGQEYKDGQGITPQMIFDYVSQTKTLPKTAAASVAEYTEFFSEQLKTADTLIHFNISSGASTSHNNAVTASKEFGGKVFVIDSKALSTGQGLLVLKACELVQEGMDAQTIVDTINALCPFVNTSFIPDTLDYLHKGGRCSLMALMGAKVLKLHPMIAEEDGKLKAKKKYMGGMKRCLRHYVEDLAEQYPNYDKTRCFITHSSADPEIVDAVKQQVAETFDFEEIIETVAGSIVTSHCGKGTLGVLFIFN